MSVQFTNLEELDEPLNGGGGNQQQQLRMQKMKRVSICLSVAVGVFSIVFIILGVSWPHDCHGKCHSTVPTFAAGSPVVSLPQHGRLVGLRKQHTFEYLGVPFAQPPTGANRFRAAQPLEPTAKGAPARLATKMSPACYQALDLTHHPTGISEDCLYLNVFTPVSPSGSKKKSLLPVMVFFYGGGGEYGSTAQSIPLLYNGTNLVNAAPDRQKVVVVTVNYRLGAFGTLALNAMKGESDDGTYGPLVWTDVRASLQWIHDNIATFGGDPGNVVTFGESAGANQAIIPLLMSGCEGLVHGVIDESGTPGFPWSTSGFKAVEAANLDFVDKAGCAGLSDTETLKCIRALPASQVVRHFKKVAELEPFDAIRVTFGADSLMKDELSYLFSNPVNYANKVPVFYGWNSDDSFIEVCGANRPANLTKQLYENYARSYFPGVFHWQLSEVDSIILPQYPFEKCAVEGDLPATAQACCDQFAQIGRSYTWLCMKRRVYDLLRVNGGVDVFQFYFDHGPTCPTARSAQHTTELAFVFNTVSAYMASGFEPKCDWTNDEKELSKKIVELWTAFAYNKNPSTEWITVPPFVKGASEQVVHLRTTGDGGVELMTFPQADVDACDTFWDPFTQTLLDRVRSEGGTV